MEIQSGAGNGYGLVSLLRQAYELSENCNEEGTPITHNEVGDAIYELYSNRSNGDAQLAMGQLLELFKGYNFLNYSRNNPEEEFDPNHFINYMSEIANDSGFGLFVDASSEVLSDDEASQFEDLYRSNLNSFQVVYDTDHIDNTESVLMDSEINQAQQLADYALSREEPSEGQSNQVVENVWESLEPDSSPQE
jgi:hypothetical protein